MYVYIYICRVGKNRLYLDSKGWEFSCPYNFIGSLPESSTRGHLVGKLLVSGLGVSLVL